MSLEPNGAKEQQHDRKEERVGCFYYRNLKSREITAFKRRRSEAENDREVDCGQFGASAAGGGGVINNH